MRDNFWTSAFWRWWLFTFFGMGLAAIVLGCGGCSAAFLPAEYEAAVLSDDSLTAKTGHAASTMCSWNNVPHIVVDRRFLGTSEEEHYVVHEKTHVRQIGKFRGGCWSWMYRYRRDKEFRVRMEHEAYCEEARFLMKRNRNPEDLWRNLQNFMRVRYDTTGLANCLYEEGPIK